jgi:pimeloyl-ACP methyl ester carboxylesterase
MKAKTARTRAMAPMTSEAILSISGLSHAAAQPASPFRFVDDNTRFILLPRVHATRLGRGSFSPRSAQSRPAAQGATPGKDYKMRNFNKGLMGAIAAASVALTAPAHAGMTVPAKAERIRAQIPGSRLVVIPGAGHTSTVEEPEAVNQALLEFLVNERGPSKSPGDRPPLYAN